MGELSIVGKSVPRVDALEKVTGSAKYCADVELPVPSRHHPTIYSGSVNSYLGAWSQRLREIAAGKILIM